jgi:selenide, water dikinase
LGPGDLAQVLCGLEFPSDPNLIVGLDHPDDAGVYRLDDETALIQTVDFFTPVVDDPFIFGQIAASNALSDVYAMGGTPLCAMNIVCFPADKMDLSLLREILRGGIDTLKKASVALAGGHSVQDPEIKYGLSVTGVVHPKKILKKGGIQPGDRLILTKPLGAGIITTAIKGNIASEKASLDAIASMITLNHDACERFKSFSVHACTDVTGFGLIGHAAEMLAEDAVGLFIDSSAVPLLEGALEYARMGLLPQGLHRNRSFRSSMTEVDPRVPTERIDLLYDPQTSGGLLAAVPKEEAERCLLDLRKAGIVSAAIIGEAIAEPAGIIQIR